MPEQARFIRGMVAWIGFRQVPFAYQRDQRFAGTTKYPLRKMIRFALDALTGFSSAPLKLASHAGLWLSVGSVLIILYILAGWLSGRAIPGWTSLMLVVVVLGGAVVEVEPMTVVVVMARQGLGSQAPTPRSMPRRSRRRCWRSAPARPAVSSGSRPSAWTSSSAAHPRGVSHGC